MIYKVKENRVFRSYIGGKHIDEFLQKESYQDGNFPEDWTASVVRAFNPGREQIVEGYGETEEGLFIKDLLKDEMRCLVKLLDSAERLVIQVHPTKPFAKEFFHCDYGKTESWYFLNCDKDACVYIGFKPNVSKEEWRRVFDEQDIDAMLSMLHRVPVKSGDCIFVEGGVPHAIGAGCFMVEVQEPSDLMGITERKTPSGRVLDEIKLHGGLGFDRMFEMFVYEGATIEETLKRYKIQPKTAKNGVREIIGEERTDKFALTELLNGAAITPKKSSGVMIVVSGEGKINQLPVKKGDRLFFNERENFVVTGNEELKILLCE